MADDLNDFQRRLRSASVDGFVNGNGQQPRRPGFRPSNVPTAPVFRSVPQASSQAPSDILPVTQQPTPVQQPMTKPQPMTNTSYDNRPRQSPSAQAAEQRPGKVPKQKKIKKKRGWVKKLFLTLGILLLIAGVGFGARFLADLAKLTGNNNPFAVLGAFQRAPLKNENGRVNVLVAGNSADDPGHNGAKLTDSIMILSIDTKKKTGMMLSIPRDMWVSIPGNGHSKINAAYAYGEMESLVDVIETNLDLPIHYTALVNYGAFKDAVDAVGGITITIKSDDPRGIYDPSSDLTSRNCCALAKYPNGAVNLNGQQALNLARARGLGAGSYGFNSDFTRTDHQRLMLLGIRDKALKSSTLSNPLKISNLVSAIGKNVTTNLQLKEIQTLYSYSKDIDPSKIDSYNINNLKGDSVTMLANYTAPDGQSTLIPAAGVDNYDDIAAQIKVLFTATPVTKEAASVVVLNATETAGLARTHARVLSEMGMSIAAQSNATVQPATTIVDVSNDKPNTLAALKKKYSATVISDATMKANYPNADIIIILGESAAPKTTTTPQ